MRLSGVKAVAVEGAERSLGQIEQRIRGEGATLDLVPASDLVAEPELTLRARRVDLVVVPWEIGTASIKLITRAANPAPVIAVVRNQTDEFVFEAVSLGVAGIMAASAELGADAAGAAFDRAAALAAERGVLQMLTGLTSDYLKRLISLERENLELREDSASGKNGNGARSSRRMLIVDDEPVIVTLVREACSQSGFASDAALSAEQAVDLLERYEYVVVLADKNLPGMSGIDLLGHVKATAPDTAVIIMTGYSSTDSAIDAVNLGAAGYLTKPFESLKEISEKVASVAEEVLKRRDGRRLLAALTKRNADILDRIRSVEAAISAGGVRWATLYGKEGE